MYTHLSGLRNIYPSTEMDIMGIGPDCGITSLLKSLELQQQTQFLDWLLSDRIIDVLYVLENIENVHIVGNKTISGTHINDPGYYRNGTLPEIFIRRLNRFIEIVKNDRKLILIRDRYEDPQIMFKIRDSILKINQNKDLKIILFVYSKLSTEIIIYDNIDYVYITEYNRGDTDLTKVITKIGEIMSKYVEYQFDLELALRNQRNVISLLGNNPD